MGDYKAWGKDAQIKPRVTGSAQIGAIGDMVRRDRRRFFSPPVYLGNFNGVTVNH